MYYYSLFPKNFIKTRYTEANKTKKSTSAEYQSLCKDTKKINIKHKKQTFFHIFTTIITKFTKQLHL